MSRDPLFCHEFVKKTSLAILTLGGRGRMRRQRPKVAKFDWLARNGPKKVLQTRSKPSSRVRALNGQKEGI